MAIAPWLDINPRDFVNAAQAGARIGTELAGLGERNRDTLNQIAGQRAIADERAQAGQSVLAARLQAQAAQQEANRQLREWEASQRLGLQQQNLERLQEEGEGKSKLAEERLGMAGNVLAARTDAMKSLEDYRNAVTGLQREREQRLQEKADFEKQKSDSGMVDIPFGIDPNNPFREIRIKLPTSDPRVQSYLGGNTNVPAAFRSGASPGLPAPTTGKRFRYDPESDQLVDPATGQPIDQAPSALPIQLP